MSSLLANQSMPPDHAAVLLVTLKHAVEVVVRKNH